ncbi:M50 family metallopeptidase [Brachybacterium huguangmaarense]
MDAETIWSTVRERTWPVGPPDAGWWTLAAVGIGLALVAIPGIWRIARLGITIVHELGHAGVGILVGRRFTGFVVNGDMSGHAVTVGRTTGPGRIASAWAGYPAPGVVGAALIALAFSGAARTAVFAALVVLVLSFVFVRSAHTLLVVVGAAALTGALWWWGNPATAAAVVLGAGVLLLLGAWRHLGAVMARGRGIDDPQQLARITPLPVWAWNASFVLVLAACTWWAWDSLAPHVL